MIVVTGATGFIGRRVVFQLIKENKPAEILCLVWRKNSHREQAGRRWLRKTGVGLREIDLLDKNSLVELPQNPRLVFHLAATTDTATTNHSCNDEGTINLVRSLGVSHKTHLVFTGTTAIFSGRTNCAKPISENSQFSPTNNYSRSKLRAEQFLTKLANQKRLLVTILRPPTVYGANPRDNSLFDFMQGLIIRGSPLARLNWPGLTSLVWVDDVAKVIVNAAKRHPRPGKVNTLLVSAESLTLAGISRLMHQRLGLRYKEINLPPWFWRIWAKLRGPIYASEKVMPSNLYNLLWRASLVVDHVIYCDAQQIKQAFPNWKPALFKDKLDEVVAKRAINEIEHFSNLQHIWWGAKTIAGQRRYDDKARLFQKYCRPKKGEKILEIGCGDGELTKRIADPKITITATDITPAVVTRARMDLKLPNVRFVINNAENLSLKHNSFNLVCGISILHHINARRALEEAYRVLRKGGRIFFTEPNLLNPLVFFGLNIKYLRRRMEFSPDETALLRWKVTTMLKKIGFHKVVVRNYDFLHPLTPPSMVEPVARLSRALETLPIVKEISGSLLIYAIK